MNSYELVRTLNASVNDLSKNSKFFEAIRYFSNIDNSTQSKICEILAFRDKEKVYSLTNELQHEMNQLISKEKSIFELFSVYEETQNVKVILTNLFNNFLFNNNNPSTIISSLDQFITCYQDHARLYTPESLHKVSSIANKVKSKYDEIFSTFNLFIHSLSAGQYQESKNEKCSEYIFGNISSAIDYSIKIKCLIEIYDRVASILAINAQYQLKIIKFETGSPWYVKVAGHPIVLTIVTNLMIAGTQYIHASYTENTPLNTIPKTAEAADKILKVTAQLKNAGFDVEEQENQVNEAISILAKDLNQLVVDQYEIEIDGKKSKINGTYEKYIENAANYMIEHKNNLTSRFTGLVALAGELCVKARDLSSKKIPCCL